MLFHIMNYTTFLPVVKRKVVLFTDFSVYLRFCLGGFGLVPSCFGLLSYVLVLH